MIALEELTGIRERTNALPRSKRERRLSNSWSFYQLRQFIDYKAIKFGVKLVLVDPKYTSQTCHNCLHIHPVKGESYRSGKKFVCGHCGWVGDSEALASRLPLGDAKGERASADLNGAKNISAIAKSAVFSQGETRSAMGSTQEEQLFKTGAVIVSQPRGSGLSCELDVRIGRKTE